MTTCLTGTRLASQAVAATNNIVKGPQVSQITQPVGLLPANTLLCARLPSLWTSISYKEDNLNYALGNTAYTDSIKEIQSAAVSA